MKRAILVIGLLGVLVCSAQAQKAITAEIPFAFTAVGIELPAGNYQFKPSSDFLTMTLLNLDTRKSVMVISFLARLGTDESGSTLVTFDKIGETRTLETIQPGEGEDGYLFAITKDKHAHEVVKVGHSPAS